MDLMDRIEALRAYIGKLKDYVRHKKHCNLLDPEEPQGGCTCGLNELIDAEPKRGRYER